MSPLDDELTAVTRRPRRAPRVLAFFVGFTTAVGWCATYLAYQRLLVDVDLQVTSVRYELEVERQAREAERSALNIKYYELQIDIERIESDNAECRAFASLPVTDFLRE